MTLLLCLFFFFFFNDTATTEIYTLSLHDALPISLNVTTTELVPVAGFTSFHMDTLSLAPVTSVIFVIATVLYVDRKSTRLNSSHLGISYAVFCLKKKKKN